MGYAFCGKINEREVGYGVEAVCDHPDCDAEIDRGMGYACGSDHGETEFSCSGYFCEKHSVNHMDHDFNENDCSYGFDPDDD